MPADLPPDLATAIEAAKAKQFHATGCGRYVIEGEASRCTCDKPSRDAAIDALASLVVTALAERGAVLARAMEALSKYADVNNWGRVCEDHHKSHYVRTDWLGSGDVNEWEGPTIARKVLSDPVGVHALAEHREMVAELEARRVLMEEHAEGCEYSHVHFGADDCDCHCHDCSCGLTARQDAARKVLDAAKKG